MQFKKRVLIIGPDFFGYNESISRAFESLGFITQIIDFGEMYTPISLQNKILYNISINRNLFMSNNQIKLNKKILKKYDKFQPDIVFVIKGNKIFEKTLKKMENTIKILWMMDSIYVYPESYTKLKYFDYLFMFEKTDVTKLAEEGITAYFLPLALDESNYYPIENHIKDIDISFIGNIFPKRMEILQRLIQEFPNKNLKFYGRYIYPSRNILQFLFRKQRQYFSNNNVKPSEANNIYNRSRICVNIHHDQSKYGVNQRFFEILGAKTLQVVDNNPFITEHFTEDEIVTYSTVDELISYCRVFLDNSPVNIIENGYRKILEQHTFTKRIKSVLEVIDI